MPNPDYIRILGSDQEQFAVAEHASGEGGGGILPFNSCTSPDFLLVLDHQLD